jgi:uncharacterized repeat protein (TIGR03847 family)
MRWLAAVRDEHDPRAVRVANVTRQVFEYDLPERFIAGTVGLPGERAFFLQAKSGRRVTSVALEKQQVIVLAERVEALLDEVLRRSGGAAPIPAVATGPEDVQPLDVPVTAEFTVGALALGWNGETNQVVIELHAPLEDDEAEVPDLEEDSDDAPDVLRVRLSGAMARAFVARSLSVVSAGRPPCQFCSLPLDPSGHICPRQNGYRR